MLDEVRWKSVAQKGIEMVENCHETHFCKIPKDMKINESSTCPECQRVLTRTGEKTYRITCSKCEKDPQSHYRGWGFGMSTGAALKGKLIEGI